MNSWRVTTNCSLTQTMKEYTPPIFCQERATLPWDRGLEIQQAVNPHWVETKKAILEILSATRHLLQKMEAHPVGQVDRRGVVAWKEKERRASREGTKVAGVDACVIVCLAECA